MRFRSFSRTLCIGVLGLASFTACGSDEKEAPRGSLGGQCEPGTENACSNDLKCTPSSMGGNVCTLAPGAECNAGDEKLVNGGCAETAICTKKDGGSATTCLIKEGGECVPESDHCENGMVCEPVQGGEHRCFGEILLRGEVKDAADAEAVPDAAVMAINELGFAVTAVARTDAMGNYELAVRSERRDDGTPVSTNYTLRAAAQNYQAFPSGARVALPIDVQSAVVEGKKYVVESALTRIDLIGLPQAERSTISGSILPLESTEAGTLGGLLVVAQGVDGSVSGLSDKSGDFTIFNVPPGDYELRGYGAGVQIASQSVSVASQPVEGVELEQLAQATTTVAGTVQIVNAPGASATSVILVVEETFDTRAARGEVPRGLRAPQSGDPSVSGSFSISGVPAGNYVVLAAYENDDLVRDPDTNIAGTDFVRLTVTAGEPTMTVDDSFKVTASLGTVSPGAEAPEAVTAKPDLVWRDDSSEDWYDVRVFDALGNEVWSSLEVPGVSGSENVTVKYEGPLDPGMYYQFRVSSWRQPGKGDASPIAATEDLRGVFYFPGQ